MTTNPEHHHVYSQLSTALEGGVTDFECRIPVVDYRSNRITVGMRVKNLPKVPHAISLRRHPAGFIRAAVESPYGLACPDPISELGCEIDQLPDDVTKTNPSVRRHQGLVVLSYTDGVDIKGADFDGDFRHIVLNTEAKELFAVQIAGAALRQLAMQENSEVA